MTTELQKKTIIDPDLSDVLALQKIDIFASMNCIKIGQIKSFDGTKRTAQVQVLFKRLLPDGTAQSYPLLIDCPVVTLQGGGGSIQFPIAAGDNCLLLFSDRCLDTWYQNGAEAVPPSTRMHDMSDAIALVGVNSLNSGLPDYPTTKMVLTFGGSTVEINSTGIKLIGTGGAEIDLAAAIATIKNATTTLNTQLGLLITAIEAIQVTGNLPLTAPSVTALEVVRTSLATLLG